MASPNILVVDSDEGFGTMLREGLNNSGHYAAICVHSGSDALQAVVEKTFDLIIIDIALTDMSPATLVKAVRDARPGLRIMMIPMMGQDLPQQLAALDINGVLPKPFFVGDLPDLVDNAMGRARQRTPTPAPIPLSAISKSAASSTQSSSPAVADETVAQPMPAVELPGVIVPQETIRFLRANETEILRYLGDLNVEVRAEAILLIAGSDLIAHSGMLSQTECQKLTLLVAQSSQAAAQAASFLGERSGRFTQSLHEGDSYRVYTLTLAEGILLSLALSTNVPLGMIRHQSRQTAEQLAKFII